MPKAKAGRRLRVHACDGSEVLPEASPKRLQALASLIARVAAFNSAPPKPRAIAFFLRGRPVLGRSLPYHPHSSACTLPGLSTSCPAQVGECMEDSVIPIEEESLHYATVHSFEVLGKTRYLVHVPFPGRRHRRRRLLCCEFQAWTVPIPQTASSHGSEPACGLTGHQLFSRVVFIMLLPGIPSARAGLPGTGTRFVVCVCPASQRLTWCACSLESVVLLW